MKQLFDAIYYIYLNRYRLISNNDSSRFPIFCIFFGIYNLYLIFGLKEFNSLIICVLSVLFLSFSIIIDRKDEDLLLEIFGKSKTITIKFLDLLIINCSFLAILIKLNGFIFFGLISILFFCSCFKFSFSKKKLALPFSNFDALWFLYFRKNPLNIFVLFLSYYVCYQGVNVKNIDLFKGSFFFIPFIISLILSNQEKIIYFKLSRLSIKKYLLKSIFSHLCNGIILLIPFLLISIYFMFFPWISFFMIIFLIINLVLIHFIFLDNSFFQNIISFMIISIFFYIQYYDNKLILFLSIILITIFLYLKTIQKLEKIKNEV